MDYKGNQAVVYGQPGPADFALGGGNYQNINGKMYFFPNSQQGNPMQPQGNYSAAPPTNEYPMNWKHDPTSAPQNVPGYGINPAGHKDYFQGGFQIDSDNIKTSQNSKLAKGYSEDYIRSLRINFQDNWMPNDGTPVNFGAPTPRELPKPIEYAGNAKKGLYPLTPSADNPKVLATPYYPYQNTTQQNIYQTTPGNTYPGNMYPGSNYPLGNNYPVQQYSTQESLKKDPRVNVVEVPREVTRYVPRIETKYVEQVVEVPGPEKIPVAKPYNVDTQLIVPKYVDVNVPLVMSQTVVPEIHEVEECVEVEVAKYVPEIVPVDVYVPRPVALQIRATGEVVQKELPSTYITPEQLQLAMDEVNPHLRDLEQYNIIQQNSFQSLIQESEAVAKAYDLPVPQPVSLPLAAIENGSNSVGRKASQKD